MPTRNDNSSKIPEAMEKLRMELARWRKTRPPRSRIPEELWARITELAGRHGVWRTAHVFGLNYVDLKRKMYPATAEAPETTFVELLPPPPPMESSLECVLDVESVRGARLRIAVKSLKPTELASMIREFAG